MVRITPIYCISHETAIWKGNNPLWGLTNHGFLPLPNWDDPPSKGPLFWANLSQPEAEETLEKPLDVLVMISAFSFFLVWMTR